MMLPEPCAIISGAACFMPSMTDRTSVAIAASKPSTGTVSMPPTGAGPPALLNRQSTRPHLDRQASNMRFTSSSRVASAVTKRQFSLPTEASSVRPSSARRPVATTLAPSATNSSTVRRPMPLVAPVTIAILPSSLPMLLSPLPEGNDTPPPTRRSI
jgi:hypothetical protein